MVEARVNIDSPESEERIEDLLDEVEGACMAQHALRNLTRLVYNNKEVINRAG